MKKTILPMLCLSILFLPASVSAQEEKIASKGYAALKPEWKFTPYEFERRPVGDDDILIEILYSGICHSDLHEVLQDWGKRPFPMVPGHEIAGRVVKTGKNVKNFKVGDHAGVGCMVNSCSRCENCRDHEEQFCDKTVWTYASRDYDGSTTMGGYSNNIVVTEKFAIRIPEGAPLDKVAPLLCAGVTTYSPLRYAGVGPGKTVAVAGFGGLGHMALQYAVAMGADEVTVFDPSEEKRALAKELGAARYVNVARPEEMKGLEDSFDVIISTIPVKFDVDRYALMLKKDGSLILLGLPPLSEETTVKTNSLMKRRKVLRSLIGGIRETREMLDFSVENDIYPKVEVIPIQRLDEAYKNVAEGKVLFRYVIDMKSLE